MTRFLHLTHERNNLARAETEWNRHVQKKDCEARDLEKKRKEDLARSKPRGSRAMLLWHEQEVLRQKKAEAERKKMDKGMRKGEGEGGGELETRSLAAAAGVRVEAEDGDRGDTSAERPEEPTHENEEKDEREPDNAQAKGADEKQNGDEKEDAQAEEDEGEEQCSNGKQAAGGESASSAYGKDDNDAEATATLQSKE